MRWCAEVETPKPSSPDDGDASCARASGATTARRVVMALNLEPHSLTTSTPLAPAQAGRLARADREVRGGARPGPGTEPQALNSYDNETPCARTGGATTAR